MKRIVLILSIMLILVRCGLSQQNVNAGSRIFFQGLILDQVDFTPVVNSQIMINSLFSGISDEKGLFSFYADRKDTVVFSKLGYKPATMFISDTLSAREYNMGIFMSRDTIPIAEVVIVPRMNNLRYDILNSPGKTPETFENAKYNVAISAYQGKVNQATLGDPADNYSFLNRRYSVNAYEKGGIPSDRILGLNPFLLIPGVYLLIKGLPEKPQQYRTPLTDKEIEELQNKYLEIRTQKK